MPKSYLPIPAVSEETIVEKIYIIRDQEVMPDRDLAEMYGVETFRLNEAVKKIYPDFRTILCFNYQKKNSNP